jgi:RNA polymerase sigma-70 factor (ECF subfamily)
VEVEYSLDLAAVIPHIQWMAGAAVKDTVEETALVDRARVGDRDAFGSLYDLYGRMVHGILMARVPRFEVDDLVQDVFMQAMARLGSLRESAAFAGWLASIARNRANDWHRQSRDTVEIPDHLAGGSRPDQEATAVLQAIRELPEAYRETLTLRLVEGMTGPEIATRTGLTSDSVRVNLHRGMKQLREKLGYRGAGA